MRRPQLHHKGAEAVWGSSAKPFSKSVVSAATGGRADCEKGPRCAVLEAAVTVSLRASLGAAHRSPYSKPPEAMVEYRPGPGISMDFSAKLHSPEVGSAPMQCSAIARWKPSRLLEPRQRKCLLGRISKIDIP